MASTRITTTRLLALLDQVIMHHVSAILLDFIFVLELVWMVDNEEAEIATLLGTGSLLLG